MRAIAVLLVAACSATAPAPASHSPETSAPTRHARPRPSDSPQCGRTRSTRFASRSPPPTSPGEYATGAAAARLVAAWDKLGIRARTIESRTFAGDAIGLVEVTAALPRKKLAAPMVLYAIAVRDAGRTWKWVSLQWTTELAKPPPAPPQTDGSTPIPHPP